MNFTNENDKENYLFNSDIFCCYIIIKRTKYRGKYQSICDNPYHTSGGIQVQHQREGEQFYAEFMEFDINFIINISSLFDRKVNSKNYQSKAFAKNRRLNFLAKAGVGLNMFRTLRQELKTEQFINSYSYQWLSENDFQDAGKFHNEWHENVLEKTFVLGFITNYKVSKNVILDFSVTGRIGGNDKWDAKLSNKADMFMSYSLGTTINLGKN